MKSILKYIRDYYNREFNVAYLFLIVLLLAIFIYLNYWHSLEKKYIAGDKSWLRQMTGYYLLYLLPFAAAFFLQPLFYSDCQYFSSAWFWIILLLAPAFFAFRVHFDFHEKWVQQTWSGSDGLFALRCINWIVRILVLLLPVFIIWWIKDRGKQPFYGIVPLDSIWPYLLMLLMMIPLILLASTQGDFLATYPKARFLGQIYTDPPKWKYLVYELCYGADFISIEFFFRGFLVLALARICGPHCIIPIACFYCCIHFGKPMGEAISSFFGGLLLGIISFNTGSVWGGLLVHLGIAWFMEIGGWLGSLVRR